MAEEAKCKSTCLALLCDFEKPVDFCRLSNYCQFESESKMCTVLLRYLKEKESEGKLELTNLFWVYFFH